MTFKRIFITAVILLILSNILMNAGDIAPVYGGPEKFPVFHKVDFSNYYLASKMLAEKGGGIYEAESFIPYAEKMGRKDIYPNWINYPAIHYTLMIPISMLDYNSAWKIWLILNHLFLIASCLFLILAFMRKSPNRTKIYAFLLLFAFSLFSASSIDAVGLGQVNTELLFLISLCIYLYTILQGNKWQFLSGIPLGLSIAVKGLPAPVALYFLWKKDWKSLGSVIASYFFFTFLPGFIFGFDLLKSYTSVKSRFIFFNGEIIDTSSYGFWRFLFPNSTSTLPILYAITSLLLLGLSLWFISRNKEGNEPAYQMALLAALIPIISPFSWSHHHVMNIIPIAALFCAMWNRENPDGRTYAALAGSFVVTFIMGTSDATFLPFYLYAETVRNHRILPGFPGLPYIYIKAFFRDYRLLFIANLGLWGILGLLLKSKASHTPAGSINEPLPASGNSKQDISKK